MSVIAVQTPDVVGERMAGPGIRAWYLAREMSKLAPTTLLALTEGAQVRGDGFPVLERRSDEGAEIRRSARILIGQPARGFGRMGAGQRIAYDLFDPTVLELRELYGSHPSPRQRLHMLAEWLRLCLATLDGNLLIAATPQQRRFYERLQANDAPWVEVPFGVDLRETRVCAKPQDNIVVWGGGVWAWLDPATAIAAVQAVNRGGLRCRLLFMGRRRPNVELMEGGRNDQLDALLRQVDGQVAVHEDWVPFGQRLAWLRAGKIAMMLHRPTAEAEVSIRTRLFDAIAAAVPVIATQGGFASDLVASEGLGIVVRPGDVEGVSAAIRRLLTDDVFHARCVENLERIRPRFAWEVVVQPLADVVREWLK